MKTNTLTFLAPVDGILREVADAASDAGLSAWVVGGVVRDTLIGAPTKDIDITVEGNAVSLALVLRERWNASSTVHTAFGTASLELEDGVILDFVSARSETYDQPGALPTVEFSGLRQDLERRDFTINAIAASLSGNGFGELVDPLNGSADLQAGLLRAMHPESFRDDPTRLFRAGRYAIRLGLEPDQVTDEAARNALREGALMHISADRRRAEVERIVSEPQWIDIVLWLEARGLWKALHPDWSPTAHALRRADVILAWAQRHLGDDLVEREAFRWLALMQTAPDTARGLMAVRPSEQAVLEKALNVSHNLPVRATLPWWRAMDEVSLCPLLMALALARTDGDKRVLTDYLENIRPIRLSISGHDLLSHGHASGPQLGQALAETLDALRAGRIHSRDEQLLFASETLKRVEETRKQQAHDL